MTSHMTSSLLLKPLVRHHCSRITDPSFLCQRDIHLPQQIRQAWIYLTLLCSIADSSFPCHRDIPLPQQIPHPLWGCQTCWMRHCIQIGQVCLLTSQSYLPAASHFTRPSHQQELLHPRHQHHFPLLYHQHHISLPLPAASHFTCPSHQQELLHPRHQRHFPLL